ncbi:DUF397 domain-containing protein [Actinomadura algeriensis]|uniref:DUF397 domain-containing protein n=1 Tax=Actinomadura algeriensis TaxID=1679523 RepID=A0ABR9JJT7_9ACTN|nr:DUF397 domain-containing protein [Actinomadura algeriensis]MBE1530807.1 hypothetical protein [Actinomadura algeriensis]
MTTWRKSSYTGAGGTDNCVELAHLADAVGIRDSKAPEIGHLSLAPSVFADLLARVKRGEVGR